MVNSATPKPQDTLYWSSRRTLVELHVEQSHDVIVPSLHWPVLRTLAFLARAPGL